MLLRLPCRLINPVVVAPTMTAVGLSFFSYGFPKVGFSLSPVFVAPQCSGQAAPYMDYFGHCLGSAKARSIRAA